MEIPPLSLRDGNKIPMLGYGTGTAWFKKAGDNALNQELVDMAKIAIQKGFYHVDCAEMYRNEEEIGIAIKEAGVPREKLWITNKVNHGIDDIPAALDKSLKKMQLTYFDMYLIHTPFFAKSDADFQSKWKAMEEIKKSGKVRSIGVSNYLQPHLEATLNGATDPPVINQIEYHPYLQRANGYVPWMQEQGVQVASFKGLTPVFRCPEGPLVGRLSRIAESHDTTESSLLIAWMIQNGVVVVTTTRQPKRLDEYAAALNLKLTKEELDEISEIGLTYHFRNSWRDKFEADDRS